MRNTNDITVSLFGWRGFKKLGSVLRLFPMLITVIGFILGGCSTSKYQPPPFEQNVDVSKSGVIFETDFSTPWHRKKGNTLSINNGYEIVMRFTDTVPGRIEREQQEAEHAIKRTGKFDITHITLWKVVGKWDDDAYNHLNKDPEQLRVSDPPMEIPGANIRLKVTVTPLSGTIKPLRYIPGGNWWRHETVLPPGQPMQVLLDLDKIGANGRGSLNSTPYKDLLKFPFLQYGGEYHIRIENMNPILLPQGIETAILLQISRTIK